MQSSLRPRNLATALDDLEDVRVLSLDCFDTLVWRSTNAPKDVFSELGSVGITAHARVLAEHTARARALREGRIEVTLAEIYRVLAPFSTDAERRDLMARELQAEAAHCFAFAPTVDLARKAKARGLQVVVVSDTYLGEDQLRSLMGSVAGAEFLALVDHVFCSSDHGRPKAGGLFEDVLARLQIAPRAILHIGDNPAADLEPALKLGFRARHLQQFDPETERRLRLEAAIAPMLRGSGRLARPVVQPHRAALALAAPDASPTCALGRGVVGPVLDAFLAWVEEERRRLRGETDGCVKLVFLMRDGHLPLRAHRARYGVDGDVCAAHISRFTAIAAGMRTREDVTRHCAEKLAELDPELLGPQLLLRPSEVVELAGSGPPARRRRRFSDALDKPAMLDRIVARSTRFRARLVEHVRAQADPSPGDRLVLVDLGYNGTVQTWIEPVLREALGVEVSGRYLLHRPQELTPFDKTGFIDGALVDDEALGALCRYIAVLEQLCTAPEGSVCDYRDGQPVLRPNDIGHAQSAVRDAVQEAAIAYVASASAAPRPRVEPCDARLAAAAVLARLLFLPLPQELSALADFQHDVNLGTSQTRALFDPELGASQLREKGAFFVNGVRRMYLPAEIQKQGLPLSLTLFASARFGLDLRHADFHPEPTRLPIMVAAPGQDVLQQEVDAHATHEGYLRCIIPVADRRLSIALQFGRLYDWVQLESLRFEPADQAIGFDHEDVPVFTPAEPVGQHVSSPSPGLLHCEDEAAFVLCPPPPRTDASPWVLTAVFRPLGLRRPAQAAAAALKAA